MMKRITFLITATAFICILAPSIASANKTSVGLRVAPQKYQETLSLGSKKAGFVDVGNTSTTAIQVHVQVLRVVPTDQNGNVAYRADERLKAAIAPEVDQFTLESGGGRRVRFTIDTAVLGAGGTYAALLFGSEPVLDGAKPASHSVLRSQVGTLLLLNVGGRENKQLHLGLTIPLIQVGSGVTGSVLGANTQTGSEAVAILPQLSVTSGLLRHTTQTMQSHLVLPGSKRSFSFAVMGSAFGLQRLTVTDQTTGARATANVLVCTGWYRLVVIVAVLAGLVLLRRKRLAEALHKMRKMKEHKL